MLSQRTLPHAWHQFWCRNVVTSHSRVSRCVSLSSTSLEGSVIGSSGSSGISISSGIGNVNGNVNGGNSTNKKRPRVVVAMSGGVDSSVAACLLKRHRQQQTNFRFHPTYKNSVTVTTTANDDDDDDAQHEMDKADSSDDCDSDNDGVGVVDVIGLHMSNWNALDEDSENDTAPKSTEHLQKDRRRGKSRTNANNDNEQKALRIIAPSTQRSISSSSSSSSGSGSGSGNYCQASEEEYNDAQSVARHLNIPLHRVSFASEYWIQVFEPFVESISSSSSSTSSSSTSSSASPKTTSNDDDSTIMGGTKSSSGTTTTSSCMPNPDFGCNTYIKFGAMKEYAMDRLEADYVATGHYAQLWHRNWDSCSSSSSSSSSQGNSKENNNYCNDTVNVNDNDNNAFYEWMEETSRAMEQSVRNSIAGRPEEEWILNNNDDTNNSNNSNTNNDHHMEEEGDSYRPMLLAGADRTKDQSYFLSGVKTEAFRRVLFPLGHLSKSHPTTRSTRDDDDGNHSLHNGRESSSPPPPPPSVREIARDANIPTASKRDSMGICFIGKRDFGSFLSQYLPEPSTPGDFVDVDTGEIVGRHEGAVRYTIGQGAKISGAKSRYFVCGKGKVDGATTSEAAVDVVFVCNDTHHPALYTEELILDFDSFNWIGLGGGGGGGGCNRNGDRNNLNYDVPRPLREGRSIKLLARTRHLQLLASCTITWKQQQQQQQQQQHKNGGGKLVVKFDKPMRAVTPGQICALYAGSDGLICLGGGPIEERGATLMDRGIGLDEVVGTSSSSLEEWLHPSGHNDLSLLR